jgi:hypothetical protein
MRGAAVRWTATLRLLGALAVALSAATGVAEAQYFSFGQNKIQYRRLDWRILRGEHVDLYYYPAEADLAPAALAYAEASYDTLAIQFGHSRLFMGLKRKGMPVLFTLSAAVRALSRSSSMRSRR